MSFWDWLKRKDSLKSAKERREKELIKLTPQELAILNRQGYFIRNPDTAPEMVATEEYAIRQGIPKKHWNTTAFNLGGWKIPFKVVNTLIFEYPKSKNKKKRKV